MFKETTLCELPEFGIGHATNKEAGTGVTVVLNKEGFVGSCDIRGGGPATRETDCLDPEKMIQEVHAIALCGGSALGLEAASGVARVLASKKIGFKCGKSYIPIVPAASVFDLSYGDEVFPDVEMGKQACEEALLCLADKKHVTRTLQGCIGAGTGVTVGLKGFGAKPEKSGIGINVLKFGKIVVGAITTVNCIGNVYNQDGTFLAGTEKQLLEKAFFQILNVGAKFQNPQNTTLSVVVTNASLSKASCKKVSQVAHDGIARAIFPVHTQMDGDSIFTLASGKFRADVDVVSTMAAKVVENSIRSAVTHAPSMLGLKGLSK